ncbi:MAG: hypothetical protein ACXAC8_02620 [Candidatus Hodarchaeales archaeon]|jgi:uncharacterized membrane protein
MIKAKNGVIATIIILVGVVSFIFLLSSSVVSSFTVKQLMDYSQPESLMNQKIQLIGVVKDDNATGFFLTDPDDRDNASLRIYINSTGVEIPTGFVVNKTVLVEGKLLSTTNSWKLKAVLISTKCPSKYE